MFSFNNTPQSCLDLSGGLHDFVSHDLCRSVKLLAGKGHAAGLYTPTFWQAA
jgi:hypothetical protein